MDTIAAVAQRLSVVLSNQATQTSQDVFVLPAANLENKIICLNPQGSSNPMLREATLQECCAAPGKHQQSRKTGEAQTWRFMGGYMWGYRSPNRSYKYSYPTYNPTYNNCP